MGIDHPSGLAGALFSSVQRRVLALLFGNPARDFSTSDVIRAAHAGTGAVHRELTRLADSGLLNVQSVGNQKRYSANANSPIYAELYGLVQKTVGVAAPIAEALAGLAGHVRAAFIYGSVAKAQDRADSDIDLMVLADDLAYADVYRSLRPAEAHLGRPINPSLMTAGEWNKKLKARNSFVLRVNAQPKIFIVGSEDDLRGTG